MSVLIILIVALCWGIATFLHKLAIEKVSPIHLPVIASLIYIFYIPIILKLTANSNIFTISAWNIKNIIFVLFATILNFAGNIILYNFLKGNNNTGITLILVSGLYPIITLILSVIILHEEITFSKIIGILLILTGIIVINGRK